MNTKIHETTTSKEEVKKDHSLGAGTGALAGAVTGGAAGTVLGPVGSLAGAVAGAFLGAKVGDEVAEMVNPTEFTQHFERVYQSQPYYSHDYTWKDYAPAYQYGYAAYGHYKDRNFNEVENELRQEWEETKLDTRLKWNEARDAVKDGWNYVKTRVDAMDGEIDRRTY